MKRREFLRVGGLMAAGTWLAGGPWETARAGGGSATTGEGPYGPLGPADGNGIRLPEGFRSRVVAVSGEAVGSTGHFWHGFPDGGATFRVRGGWVYVSNSEIPLSGGVGALRFDHEGRIVDAYPVLQGTWLNCAGGATPWETWLSCEEVETAGRVGHVYECDPEGIRPAVVRPAMGGFSHEAVAADPVDRRLYLTEDQPDGCLYRFTPDGWGDLSSGLLEVARVTDDGSGGPGGDVDWLELPNPDPGIGAGETPTRHQVPEATAFDGGEGIVYHDGHIFFSTKGDGRVWDYVPETGSLCTVYDPGVDVGGTLSGVDNLAVSRFGDLYVAEDGGNMELVMLTPGGVAAPILQVEGQDTSEITGPAFDPWERRLYFSSQRGGATGAGLTYEITGPFRQRAHC
jgi:hypothetical protein